MSKTQGFNRRRRGLINGIGVIANEVFGVLDHRFAEQYKEDIEKAKEDKEHIGRLIRNQTSIFDATANLMKKSQQETVAQFEVFGREIDKIRETRQIVMQQKSGECKVLHKWHYKSR